MKLNKVDAEYNKVHKRGEKVWRVQSINECREIKTFPNKVETENLDPLVT